MARVNYSTGNLMLAATDFDISGVGRRLQLTRTYNSLDARRLAEQTDPAELAERRRRSDAARARRHRVELLRAIFRAVDARDPLRPEAARGLLIELADAEQHSMATLGTSAGLPARWHPDVEGGDGEIFQLLETAYRTVKLLP
ncbi:DUF6531 domain-containing protein [Streptomyces qinglanensis]|uniref:DUF6531 domain-containing protein n=1 Tax=Streptomyces qinglanensis TaxID=943816 RepID=UPI0037A0B913